MSPRSLNALEISDFNCLRSSTTNKQKHCGVTRTHPLSCIKDAILASLVEPHFEDMEFTELYLLKC